MNILIPDSWLREYLKTNATPQDMKRCLSLCGPSIERMYTNQNDTVYDIEITTNRVDAYSIYGIAREASVILPTFGIDAALSELSFQGSYDHTKQLDIDIQNNPQLCKRILAVKMENVIVNPSPKYIQERLTAVGQRPLNNLIDITNYVMWETGHPCHVFDYDRLVTKKIIVREATTGEEFITLDHKKHIAVGGEIIFDDSTGTIIDLPGIMGTANTVVTEKTKNILLFIENSDPKKIRFSSMKHAIRSQAAVINEKSPDAELTISTLKKTIDLVRECAHGTQASKIYDEYPKKMQPPDIHVSYDIVETYINTKLSQKQIASFLKPLGFSVSFSKNSFTATPPSWRIEDIESEEDIVEEIARLYGYHNIPPVLPNHAPPYVKRDPSLEQEETIKTYLRDWGYTELLTYSMISADLMNLFHLNTSKSYKITNPLSKDWVYMRPSLIPSLLAGVKQNLARTDQIKFFEMSPVYLYRPGDLPDEHMRLVIALAGTNYENQLFFECKGIVEALFSLLGISHSPSMNSGEEIFPYKKSKKLIYSEYGAVGEISESLLSQLSIHTPVVIADLSIRIMLKNANLNKIFSPIPKYPPSYEDLALIVPPKTPIGEVLSKIQMMHPLIVSVTLLDSFENVRTVHITYQDREKNLTADDIRPIREHILHTLNELYNIQLKTHDSDSL